MPDFKSRSTEKELLDRNDIPFADIKKNMEELEIINSRLGGHRITIDGVRKLISEFKNLLQNQGYLTIVEIGCGGGNNLAAIADWAKKKSINLKLIGVDINPDCIAFAREKNKALDIEFICDDYKIAVPRIGVSDIFIASLFCHHFNEEEFQKLIRRMITLSRAGFVINDLHRHPVAYYSIKYLTKIFSKSYLVKNDAPLSVLRGFKRNELEDAFKNVDKEYYYIKWKWAFRWQIIYSKHLLYKRFTDESVSQMN